MSPYGSVLIHKQFAFPVRKSEKKMYRKSESFDSDDYGSGTVCIANGEHNLVTRTGMHKDTT